MDDVAQHFNKKQNTNESFTPCICLPEWAIQMLPGILFFVAIIILIFLQPKQLNLRKRYSISERANGVEGAPQLLKVRHAPIVRAYTFEGQIDVSKKRMFADILPQVLRKGPYRMDIIERVREVITMCTAGLNVKQWLEQQNQSI